MNQRADGSTDDQKCDILLKSIINSSNEQLEKIEVTTIRDIYEKTVWISEAKPGNKNKAGSASQNKKRRCSKVMDDGDKNVIETHESVIQEITQTGQDDRLLHNEKADQNTTEITEHDQVDGLQYFEPASTQEIDMNTSEGSIYYEVDTTLENDESANLESANQEADGLYPQIEDVKRIEVELHQQRDGSSEINVFEEEFIDTLRQQSVKSETESERKSTKDNQSTNENDVTKNNNNDASLSSASDSPKDNYQHARYDQFDKLTRKYFKYIHRYHLGDTVPIYFRSQFQMQMRSLGANCLTIGLFGQAGSGKSAFLNSLYSTMNGSYIEYSAERRSTGDALKGATNERIELRLTETITVLDNRATDFSKTSIKEIVKQLGKNTSVSFFLFIKVQWYCRGTV